MDYKKGARVKHPNVPDWGPGEVLEDSAGDSARVFFVGAGEVKLVLKELELERLTNEAGKHPILDNLKLTTDKTLRYRTLPACIQQFLVDYPGGLYGEKFADWERDYKLKTHSDMTESLSEVVFKSLLKKEDYEEITRRALKLISASNFTHLHEKLALKNGLDSPDRKGKLAQTVYSYLFGDAPFEKRFNEFANFWEGIEAGKWTIITLHGQR